MSLEDALKGLKPKMDEDLASQLPFIDKLQKHVGECRFRERSAVHDGVCGQRKTARAVAVSGDVHDLTVLDDSKRHTLYVFTLHQASSFGVNRSRFRQRRFG